jgi:hypothetical protein
VNSRKSKQRRILVIACVVLGALVWVKLATMLVFAGVTGSAWNTADYPRAEQFSELLLPVNVIEKHRAHFNLGTARAARGDLTGARAELAQALKLTTSDDECDIRLNLALVLEALGEDEAPDSVQQPGTGFRDQARAVLSGAPVECREELSPLEKRMEAPLPPQDPDKSQVEKPAEESDAPVEEGDIEEQQPAMNELEARMGQGQDLQRSEQMEPGAGKAPTVNKPW